MRIRHRSNLATKLDGSRSWCSSKRVKGFCRSTLHAATLQNSRHGVAAISSLIEILLIGFIVCGVVFSIPLIMGAILQDSPESSGEDAPQLPIIRLAAIREGNHLWVQRGITEIVNLNVATRQPSQVYKRNGYAITGLSVSKDGSTFAIVTDDREVSIYRNQQLIVSEEFSNGSALKAMVSSDGQFAIRMTDKSTARYWDLSSCEPIHSDFEISGSAIKGALDKMGNQLAVATSDGKLHIYDVRSGVRLKTLTGDDSPMSDPIFSEDGRFLAVIRRHSLEMNDICLGEIVWTVPIDKPEHFHELAISHNGKWIAMTGIAKEVCLFNVSNGMLEHKFSTESVMRQMEFSISDDTLYVGSLDGSVRVWSLPSGNEMKSFARF